MFVLISGPLCHGCVFIFFCKLRCGFKTNIMQAWRVRPCALMAAPLPVSSSTLSIGMGRPGYANENKTRHTPHAKRRRGIRPLSLKSRPAAETRKKQKKRNRHAQPTQPTGVRCDVRECPGDPRSRGACYGPGGKKLGGRLARLCPGAVGGAGCVESMRGACVVGMTIRGACVVGATTCSAGMGAIATYCT